MSRAKCVKYDRQLARLFIKESLPLRLLDSEEFSKFVQELLPTYRLPSREFLLTNIIQTMLYATQDNIKNNLDTINHIALTVDAWTSIAQQSYITITASVINWANQLQKYVLDTSEITTSHHSEKFLLHICGRLEHFNIRSRRSMLNLLNGELPDFDDEEYDDGPNYLLDETQKENEDEFDKGVPATNRPRSEKEIAAHLNMLSDSSQNDEESIRFRNLTVTTDNESSFVRAMSRLGGFRWLGCAAHHLNLVCQIAFKRVPAAAALVKNCKKIVELVHKSSPANYKLVENQGALGMAKKKLVQENVTRWWSILTMFETIVENLQPILGVLGFFGRSKLSISHQQEAQIRAIITLMADFRVAGDILGSENEVTVSKILPTFESLKTKLKIDPNDQPIIKEMKKLMLEKMNSRYSDEQIKFLAACSILDIKMNVDGCNSSMRHLVTGGLEFLQREATIHFDPELNKTTQKQKEKQAQKQKNYSREASDLRDLIYENDDDDTDVEEETTEKTVETEIETFFQNRRIERKKNTDLDILEWWEKKG